MVAARHRTVSRLSHLLGLFALSAVLLVTGLGTIPQLVRSGPDAGQAALSAASSSMPDGLDQLVAGGEHTCGIAAGRLSCWGRNTWGQIGNGSRGSAVASPDRVGTASNWRRVAVGGASTCGVRGGSGVLYCWGLNNRGQIGDNSRKLRLTPHRVPGSDWQSVDNGWFHTCGIKSKGRMYCWGDNAYGELGQGNRKQTLDRKRVPGSWRSVSVEGWTTCGVKSDRSLWCWGRNVVGQVGDGTGTDRSRPVRVGTPSWSQVSVSWTHTCGLRASGKVLCWGSNDRGQIGDGTTQRRFRPTAVRGGLEARSIGASEGGSCLVTRNDGLWCWGDNKYKQAGGSGGRQLTPHRREGSYRGVTAGWLHSCAMRTGGGGTCFGLNERGQLARPAYSRQVAKRPPSTNGTRKRGGPLTVSMASLNVLGEHHTGAYRHDDRFAPSRVRAEWTAQLIRTHSLDVVGIQEPSEGQVKAILSAGQGQLAAFPDPHKDSHSTETTLLWDQTRFQAVKKMVIRTQFIRRVLPRPVVKLRDRATGREFWVMNIHNAPWDYQSRRNEATAEQIAKLQELEKSGLPVYYLGDFNEWKNILCKVLRKTDMNTPIGGRIKADGTCVAPRVMRVDWIFGSKRTEWRNFHFSKTPMIRLATDHWVPMTVVRVP